MASRCWQLVLLVLALALPAARTAGRALAPDTSSPGSLPFHATQKFLHTRCFSWQGRRRHHCC